MYIATINRITRLYSSKQNAESAISDFIIKEYNPNYLPTFIKSYESGNFDECISIWNNNIHVINDYVTDYYFASITECTIDQPF